MLFIKRKGFKIINCNILRAIGAHLSVENDRSHTNVKYLFFTWNTLIGVLLVVTGVVFLVNPDNLRIKVGASLIIFGVFCFLLIRLDEKDITNLITDRRLTLILALWVFLVLILTYNIDADIFLIIVILGILILIELLSDFFSALLKKRKTILFYVLLIAFIVVIEQSVIHHLLLK